MAESGRATAAISVARQLRRKSEHHDDGEDRALDQRVHRGLVVAVGVGDGVVDQRRCGRPGCAGRSSSSLAFDDVGDRQLARALGAEDREGDDRFAVEAGEGAQLLMASSMTVPRSDRRTSRPPRQRDRGVGQLLDGARAGERADRLLLAADLAAPAAQIDVGGADLAVDVGGGDAEAPAAGRDRARSGSRGRRRRSARRGRRPAGPASSRLIDVVDEPGQLLERHAGRRDRVGQDRLALDVDALDDRLVDVARQVGADLVDRVLDVVDRAVGVDLHAELDDRRRHAVGDGRDDVLDAGDAGDGVLDLAGDLASRARPARRPTASTVTETSGTSMFGKRVIGSVLKLMTPSSISTDEQHDRRHRPADRPGRDIEAHYCASLILASGPTVRTASPSRRKVPARATTRSPSDSPSLYLDEAAGNQSGFDVAAHDAAVAHDLHEGAAVVEHDSRRGHADAVALRRLDGSRGRSDPMRRRASSPRKMRTRPRRVSLVDFRRDEPHRAFDVADAGDVDARLLAGRRPWRARSRCTSASSSISPRATMRNIGSPAPAAMPPMRAVRRLTRPSAGAVTSVFERFHMSSRRCASTWAFSAWASCRPPRAAANCASALFAAASR